MILMDYQMDLCGCKATVTMRVVTVPADSTLSAIRMLLLDSDDTIVQQILASDTGSYLFSDVSPGDYSVIATSDVDNDHLSCTVGEVCGEDVVIVTDNDINDADVTVDVQSSFTTTATTSGAKQAVNFQVIK